MCEPNAKSFVCTDCAVFRWEGLAKKTLIAAGAGCVFDILSANCARGQELFTGVHEFVVDSTARISRAETELRSAGDADVAELTSILAERISVADYNGGILP